MKLPSINKSASITLKGTLIAILITVNIWFYGKPFRDNNIIEDVETINVTFKNQTIIPVSKECLTHWTLIAYLQRNYKKSIQEVSETDTLYVSMKDQSGARKLNEFYLVKN